MKFQNVSLAKHCQTFLLIIVLACLVIIGCDLSKVEDSISYKEDLSSEQLTNLSVSIDWQDESGTKISWPGNVVGVKVQLKRQENDAEAVNYGNAINFTSDMPYRSIEDVLVQRTDKDGNKYSYTYATGTGFGRTYTMPSVSMIAKNSGGYSLPIIVKRNAEDYHDPEQNTEEQEVVIIEIDDSEPNFQLYNLRATTNVIYQTTKYELSNLDEAIGLFQSGSKVRSTTSAYPLGNNNKNGYVPVWAYTYYYRIKTDKDSYSDILGQDWVDQRLWLQDTVYPANWLVDINNPTDYSLLHAVLGTGAGTPAVNIAYTPPVPTVQGFEIKYNEYPDGFSSIDLSDKYDSYYENYVKWERSNQPNTTANYSVIKQLFTDLYLFNSTPGKKDLDVYREFSSDEEEPIDYVFNIANENVGEISEKMIETTGGGESDKVTIRYNSPAWTESVTLNWRIASKIDYGQETSHPSGIWENYDSVNPQSGNWTSYITLDAIDGTGDFEKTITKTYHTYARKETAAFKRIRDISFSSGSFDVVKVECNPELVYNYVQDGSDFYVALKEDDMPTDGQVGWIIKVTLEAKGQSATKTISLYRD